VVAKCKLGKSLSILKIFPAKNEGPTLSRVTINRYWASYKKGHLEYGLSDWSDVELRYDYETQAFTVCKVKLRGI
jgi:hypothetical protein